MIKNKILIRYQKIKSKFNMNNKMKLCIKTQLVLIYLEICSGLLEFKISTSSAISYLSYISSLLLLLVEIFISSGKILLMKSPPYAWFYYDYEGYKLVLSVSSFPFSTIFNKIFNDLIIWFSVFPSSPKIFFTST